MKAYLVRSDEYQWIKPYLFHSEAAEIAELMTVASGKFHWTVETEVGDSLNALVRFKGKELIVTMRNINAIDNGFEADVVIEDHLYKVRHLYPFGPWTIVPLQKDDDDFPPDLNPPGAPDETDLLEIAPSNAGPSEGTEAEAEFL